MEMIAYKSTILNIKNIFSSLTARIPTFRHCNSTAFPYKKMNTKKKMLNIFTVARKETMHDF